MSKTDFTNFPVGTVFNKAKITSKITRKYSSVKIAYPSRLEAMALDPSKIADNNDLVYEAGQIDFCVSMYKNISVSINKDSNDIIVSARTPRKSLVRHAALIMQNALGLENGFNIDVQDEINLRHCGLGSSSSLIAGVASAINELYGMPINPLDLARFCAQNHGEEADNNDAYLVPVQCIGGSAVCGNFVGGAVILSGQATPVMTAKLSEDLRVVFGVPSDFKHPDSQELMNVEVENIDAFRESGKTYGPQIAYRLVHKVMPALVEGDLKPMKDLIFDYRWDMDSIKNCSFVYPRMNEIAESLRCFKDDSEVDIIALSSVGPGFFAITNNTNKVEKQFQKLGMTTYITTLHNEKYKIIESESLW